MIDFVEREQVDIVLMSGDVFDNRSPSGKAERLVARVFRDIAATGAQTVVIAGNHDSPTRLGAWKLLAELADVHIIPRPAPRDRGGVIELQSRDGTETAVIAGIPFAAASRLVSGDIMADDDTKSYQRYSDAFQGIVRHLAEAFRDDTLNVIMAHTHLESAILSRSERTVHTGEQWAAQPHSLPPNAHYVALGHIHKPQKVTAPAQAYYAGSPMQLDFGELHETKTFNLVEATPGLPVKVSKVEYEGALPLEHFEGTLEDLRKRADEFRDRCWLRAVIKLEERNADLSRVVREIVPNTVVIHAELTNAPEEEGEEVARDQLELGELFELYYRMTGLQLSDEVRTAFNELHDEVTQ